MTCSVAGCARPICARSLCRRHYDAATRAGTLDDFPALPRLRKAPLTDVDLEKRRATCPVHGPGVPLRIRDRGTATVYVACSRCDRASHGSGQSKKARNRRARHTKYGLTDAEFAIMSEAQAGRCLICQQRADRLCIDHDHKTGAVRGLLCHRCNVGIGWMNDDPKILTRAAKYLRRRQF